MKNGIFTIALSLLVLSISNSQAASFVNLYGNEGTNGSIVDSNKKAPTFPANEKNCTKWQQVCVDNAHCTYRSPLRDGCYRCLKPSHFGVHLYPRMQSRDTCNYETAQYLRTMGYRCYVPYQASTCERTVTTQECYLKCVAHSDTSEPIDY